MNPTLDLFLENIPNERKYEKRNACPCENSKTDYYQSLFRRGTPMKCDCNRPHAVDLFAGAGGISIGLEKAGFHVVLALERNPVFARTYSRNFKGTNKAFHKVIVADITSEKTKDLIVKELEGIHVDLVAGGPPCQAYSTTGFRHSGDSRAYLFKDFFSIIEFLSPSAYLLENVPGITSARILRHTNDHSEKEKLSKLSRELEYSLKQLKRLEQNKSDDTVVSSQKEELKNRIAHLRQELQSFEEPVLNQILELSKNLCYETWKEILDASEYGVPQRRKRFFLIGLKNRKFNFSPNDHKKTMTPMEALSVINPVEENSAINHVFQKHSPAFREKISKLKIGESLYPNFKGVYYRIFPNKPTPTIRDNNGSVFIHWEYNRTLSVRDMALLQGFPVDYIFEGNKVEMYTQIGNAVPPPLIEVLGVELIKHLNSETNRDDVSLAVV